MMQIVYSTHWAWSLKEFRWTKLSGFLFGVLTVAVDFDLGHSKKIENMKKLNTTIFYNKNIDFRKMPIYPYSWNPGSKTGLQNDTLS